MLITDLAERDCYEFLRQEKLGRLGCAHENQPYIVPMFYALDGSNLYGFSTVGLKFEWMRANPRVCVEVDRIRADDDWVSVVVLGVFEELRAFTAEEQWNQEQRRAQAPGTHPTETPVAKSEAQRAHDLLEAHHPQWFEPGVASSIHRNPNQRPQPIYYRVRIDRVSGRRASPGQ